MISADKRHIPGAGHKNSGLNTAAIYCSSWIRGSSCRGSVIQTLYAQSLSPFLHCEALYLVMEPGWRRSIVIFCLLLWKDPAGTELILQKLSCHFIFTTQHNPS